ncbi:non-ribosomal peptide synthetase [Pseudomonas sp. KNUC1026]|uniref:non-ribosomal peptide synthetase n=1 Tax=Pseudomonas sp. KNUC1026 TaxID=2893890 RepID=UPI0022A738B1|nr:non-ribosomal peptide synthetase [Pseudomonas sp. KNUC1026]
MNAEQALKLARRFIELPLEKRRLFLAGLQAEGVAFPVLPIAAGVEVPEREGLSYAQQRMWFLWQLDPASAAYNLPMAVGLRGPVNITALRQAFEGLVARHETLRTRFVQLGDQVLQRVDATQPVTVRQDDLSAHAAPDAEVERIADLEAQAPFDLVDGPLWRVRLLRVAADHHVLLLTLHHIVADGWSMNVLIEEFVRLYDAAAQGQAAGLPPLAIQYRDYALWQRSWLEAGEQARQLAYWQAQLGDDHAPLEMPLDHPRPAQPSYRGARHEFSLDATLTERLRGLARQHNVTLFMVLLASFKLLLQRYSGQREVRVGVPIANRNQAQTEGLIGCFINTQVLHTDLDPLLTVPQLLARVRDTALGAQAHQELPFERLVEALDVPRNAQSPLFQVLFNHQANVADVEEIRLASGLSLARMALRKHSARFDLALDTHERGGQLHAAFTYALDLFDEASIVSLGQHWLSLVEALAAQPMLGIGELARVTAESVNTQAITQPTMLVPQWTEQASVPSTLAVVAGDDRWSHAELRQRADAVATHLHAAGVQPDEVVGIVADRSAAMLASIIGVLRAGAAYLPLEPEQPTERLQFMLAGSGVKRVLAPAAWAAQLPAGALRIDPATLPAGQPFSAVAVQPGNLAYVIYTSGTTGQPKAVGISHGALASYLSGVFERLPMDALGSLAMVSTPAADLGHTVLFGALCTGKTLHLLSKDLVLDASAFAAYLAAERIDAVKIVPSHLQALLGEGRDALPARCLVLGGEAVPASLLARIRQLAPELAVINHYGPTETTVGVITAPLAGQPLLGTPLRGVRAAVLDGGLHPVLPGVKGELYLGGASLARGYLGQPALTAERFVPAAGGERLYRSGDWVRQDAEGCLHFVGRMDGQVKIRGYRVELAEIEKQLAALPGIRQAVVRVLGEGEARHLAGWLVVEHAPESGEAALEHLRGLARQRLPEHMLPSHLMLLEHLPVTANGKLDAKALLLPQAQVTEYIAPHTELQTQAAAIWAQVLQVPQVGLGDNFFALGGHSLLATQVVGRLRQQLQLDVPLRLLFDTADLGAFAAELQRLEQGTGQPIAVLDRSGPLPLSPAQHRQWLFWKLNPSSAAYNTPMAVRMRGTLDRQALQAAFDALVARHESLRTRYVEVDEQPHQVIEAAAPVALVEQDLRGQPASAVASQVEAEILATFDLEHGPLLRARLLQVDDDEHLLVMTLHHIASDGWSMGVLVREFAAFYNARARQQALVLPTLPVHYADYASWQREQLEGGLLDEQLSYWKTQLEGDFSVLQLPTDRPRPALPSYRGGKVDLRLPPELVERLRQLASGSNATLFHVFLAAFALLLSRYSGQSSLNIGVPMTHRNRLELEGLVGFFVNSVVARVKVDALGSVEQFLASVRETALQAQAHKDTPFDLLVDALQPARNPGHNPLFQVMFNHLRDVGERVNGAALEGLQVEEVVLPERTAQFDLALDTSERSDGVLATFSYASDLFDEARIEHLAEHWVNLLRSIASSASGCVGSLSMLSAAERQRVAHHWNLPARSFPAGQFVHRLIEAQVQRTPDAPALVLGGEEMTYAALNRAANRLAHRLIELGVGPEVRVGIAVERSLEMVVGLLGVLKAGGAYVPMDPEYPAERLAYMLEDSQIALLLTQARLTERLATAGPVHLLALDADDLGNYSAENPANRALIDSLAYVMYTSGSTGKPKGVSIAHRVLGTFAQVAADYSHLTAHDHVLQFATLSFDGFVEQLYPALCVGARVVLRGNGLWSTETLRENIQRYGVTVADLPAAYWKVLALEGSAAGLASLRQVHVGGEAMSTEALAAWLQADTRGIRLLNTYGPTEATVVATTYDCAAPRRARCPSASRCSAAPLMYATASWNWPPPVPSTNC